MFFISTTFLRQPPNGVDKLHGGLCSQWFQSASDFFFHIVLIRRVSSRVSFIAVFCGIFDKSIQDSLRSSGLIPD